MARRYFFQEFVPDVAPPGSEGLCRLVAQALEESVRALLDDRWSDRFEREHVHLEGLSGYAKGRRYYVGRSPCYGLVSVGRCPDCTVFLPDPGVAKHHAYLVLWKGRYLICSRIRRGHRVLLNDRA